MLTKNDQYVSPKLFSKLYDLPISWVYRHCMAEGLLANCTIKLGKYTRIDLAKASKVLGIDERNES